MDARESAARAKVAEAARGWVGTPFHDNACVKGHGVDCAQLLKGVFVEAGAVADFKIDHYSPQFFLHQDEERFLNFVLRFAREIPREQATTADVVLYKVGRVFAHGAIIVDPGWPSIIHAHYAARRVREGNGEWMHLGAPIKDVKFFSRW